MAKGLLLLDEKTVEIVDVEVTPGFIDVPKYGFRFYSEEEENKPLMLIKKTPFGIKYEPLYILKWDSVFPGKVQIENKTIKIKKKSKTLNKVVQTVTIVATRDKKFTPEVLKKVTETKVIGNIIPTKKKIQMNGLAVGIVLGAILMYLMIVLKVIKI